MYLYHLIKRSLLLPVFLIVLIGIAQPVLAIGPGTGGSKIRVDNRESGPFILLVATSPLPVTLDQEMSVWVRVTDIKSNVALRDPVVMIEATHRETKAVLTAEATHKNSGNPHDYVAHLPVEQTGPWDVKVLVEDKLGDTEVAFTESVSRGQTSTILIVLGIPFLALALFAWAYLWRRAGQAQA
ncbi:MAG: hypothetical protein AAF485_25855 [Chloroflexota bacterium]